MSFEIIKYFLFVLLLGITFYSRFLNLNWDEGWGFHPDENNLWGASRRVELFTKLDPGFYAYGGFPIYLYSLLAGKVEARVVSAGAQVLIVILLFVIGKRMAGWNAGFFAAAMGTFSAGLVQAGHFLTVESLLGLFGLVILFCLLEKRGVKGKLVVAAVVLGLGVGTKVSFAVFAIPLFLIVLRSNLWFPKVRPFQIVRELAKIAILPTITILVFLLTNPFIFSKWNEVKSTLEYEAKVATGNLPVFYTRQFIDTIPGWFQAVHVFPYITSWLFLPMVFGGIAVLFIQESPGEARRLLVISIVAVLLSFLPFWAKWTRYAVGVLPILILIAGIGGGWIWEKGKLGKFLAVIAVFSFLPQFFSTLSVYSNEDTRITAAKWSEINIPVNSKIFTEAMDLGILPFNPTFGQNIKLFNFYELDEVHSEAKQAKLGSLIDESDYFVLLSRRVYKNSLGRPDKFPRTAVFYRSLFDGSLGYEKIYESIEPSSFFLLPSSLYSPEETLEVFDNPKVMIFKNVRVSHRLSRWRKFARSPSPSLTLGQAPRWRSGWPQTAAVSLANLPTSIAVSVRNSCI